MKEKIRIPVAPPSKAMNPKTKYTRKEKYRKRPDELVEEEKYYSYQ